MKIRATTTELLRRCQKGLKSDEPHVVEAAESVMSALALNLRYEQALLPEELQDHINVLRKATTGCKVSNTRKSSATTNH